MDARPLSYSTSGVSRVISRILLHFPDKKKYRFILYSNRPCHSDFSNIVQMANIEWREGKGFFARYGGTWFNISLPMEIKKNPIDIFWGSQQVLPPFLSASVPAVLTYYDLVLFFFPEAMRFLARMQQQIFQKYSVMRSKRILSISTRTMLDMIEKFHYPAKQAKVSLLGYEFTGKKNKNIQRISAGKKKSHKLPSGGTYILSVSTMEPRKNYGTLLEAYKNYLILDKKPLNLVIAGRRGWENHEFFQNLDGMIEEGSVITFENADDFLIEELYKNCAFFTMPALYEGFGLPLLEALCHGKYAIASDIDPFHEIGGNAIEYVKPLDIKGWTGALLSASERLRSKKLKLKGFNKSEWSWDRTAKIHYEAFEELSD